MTLIPRVPTLGIAFGGSVQDKNTGSFSSSEAAVLAVEPYGGSAKKPLSVFKHAADSFIRFDTLLTHDRTLQAC